MGGWVGLGGWLFDFLVACLPAWLHESTGRRIT